LRTEAISGYFNLFRMARVLSRHAAGANEIVT
jgi:hypothetical protein